MQWASAAWRLTAATSPSSSAARASNPHSHVTTLSTRIAATLGIRA
jgi:hypothetical protein